MFVKNNLELVCPAGTPAALRYAVEAGADTVYLGFRDETNARNYPGLNFSYEELKSSVAYAHEKNVAVFVAINTNPKAGNMDPWKKAVDNAVSAGADAVILSDLGLISYTAKKYPNFRIHLSVQAFASTVESVNFYQKEFGIKRAVLPRIFTLREIEEIIKKTTVEVEIFAFAVAGPMAEGRCILSSYVTGKSPNSGGACSPAEFIEYQEDGKLLKTKLNGVLVNQVEVGEPAGYPTLCRGRYVVNGEKKYLFENPSSLNVIDILPRLKEIGVVAIKIEGRQRGKSYVREVVSTFRNAIDNGYSANNTGGENDIAGLCEGCQTTSGAFRKKWL